VQQESAVPSHSNSLASSGGLDRSHIDRHSRWQENCCEKARQILVALKRNDAYALNIKVLRRVTHLMQAGATV
jgi:hypothetical protein